MRPRYDPDTCTYRDCRFCHGAGCLACPEEADKAYKEAFPDGPKPIATITDPAEVKAFRDQLDRASAEPPADDGDATDPTATDP